MRSKNNVRVGLFVSFLTLLLGAFLFFVSGSTKIFSDRYTLITEWKDVSGLKEGAIVRLSGWDVGEVVGIQFAKENKRTLVVHLSIENQYKNLIRQCTKEQESPQDPNISPKVSSRARIDTVGILGDKLVTINMGDSSCSIIENGQFIYAEEAIDIIEYAKKVTSIVNRLNSIGRKVDIMLGTEEDARITSRSIASSVYEMEGMIKEVKEGGGLIHALLYDKKLSKKYFQKPQQPQQCYSFAQYINGSIGKRLWCRARITLWNQWSHCNQRASHNRNHSVAPCK